MKTTLPIFLLLISINAISQGLVFNNPTLKTANNTDLKKGAVYLFKSVTTGINAEVTITDLVNGATVTKIDDNGGGVGYADAFQPEIKSGNKGESYALFTIKFIEVSTNSPYLLKSLQATALDIDGTSELKEFDEINMNGGTAAFMGGTLQLTMKKLPIIGTLFNIFRADNTTGVDKNGIDTSSKGNMFTVTNSNVNSFTVKLGATTTKNSNIARQYSIYMKGFQYPNLVMLPLKLLSFTASLKNNTTVLNWSTTSEDHVASYIVEHSVDGTNFTTVGNVAPTGNMTDVTKYSFTDDSKTSSVAYYRLRCLDMDGRFVYSAVEIVKSTSATAAVGVSAYPNPFSSVLTVRFSSSIQSKQARIELFNANGQLVKTQVGNGATTETVETSNLERGIYIVRVSLGTENTQYKVVKS